MGCTGGRPFGIHFSSKHGAGWCKALWLDHPDASNILTLSPEPILVTDDALKTAADRFRIRASGPSMPTLFVETFGLERN